MENVVRVDCLYRVSTIGQVEKNDIPMQREFCRAFIAEHPNWKLEKEVYEKGVSGFKKSAKERDAIQELQRDAVEGKFDILLVYMFDRLGRKDDETPFIVEWFVRNGVEVWSATEGQQRFDNHVDKLLNYIRYWQASGESIKTSVRTKTRLEQLTESGFYTGGSIAYGYRLDKRGRTNKRNKEVFDLAIDEDAAKIIQLIFQKYVNEGYGEVCERGIWCPASFPVSGRKENPQAERKEFSEYLHQPYHQESYLYGSNTEWGCTIGIYSRITDYRPGNL